MNPRENEKWKFARIWEGVCPKIVWALGPENQPNALSSDPLSVTWRQTEAAKRNPNVTLNGGVLLVHNALLADAIPDAALEYVCGWTTLCKRDRWGMAEAIQKCHARKIEVGIWSILKKNTDIIALWNWRRRLSDFAGTIILFFFLALLLLSGLKFFSLLLSCGCCCEIAVEKLL